MPTESLPAGVLRGDRVSVAKAITEVENGDRDAESLLRAIGKKGRRSFVLGVTGPPGTGKSTIVDRLIEEYRRMRVKVGVVAVDPTSPITGGALLGDRVRMMKHTMDNGVFIRSMASRGWAGGLSGAVSEAIQILDAAGFGVIIIETVGIGQADIEIMKIAHTVMVVTIPGLGDEVQVSKAGLMEIGDIYTVNKGDLPGADAMVINLLGMVRDMKGRSPPVLKVSALKGEGVSTLFEAVEKERKKALSPQGKQVRLRSARGMVVELAKRRVLDGLDERVQKEATRLASEVVEGRLSFGEAADLLSDGEQ
ncbi:MAG: methylmalonyl Co-A mutase-associated GTPase MeaB [Thaumarchaeota archaeon]|nr:methylmalonyl Co-A mutase-associated GTPase MeaB [Nitrososphaerota archaeon]